MPNSWASSNVGASIIVSASRRNISFGEILKLRPVDAQGANGRTDFTWSGVELGGWGCCGGGSEEVDLLEHLCEIAYQDGAEALCLQVCRGRNQQPLLHAFADIGTIICAPTAKPL